MKTTRRIVTLAMGFATAALLSLDLEAQGGAGQTATETLSQTYRGSRLNDIEYQKIPPFKIFDNLYHVGPGTVSAWLIPTTDGLILIDTVQEVWMDHLKGVSAKFLADEKAKASSASAAR